MGYALNNWDDFDLSEYPNKHIVLTDNGNGTMPVNYNQLFCQWDDEYPHWYRDSCEIEESFNCSCGVTPSAPTQSPRPTPSVPTKQPIPTIMSTPIPTEGSAVTMHFRLGLLVVALVYAIL